jgi:c-di-GMP-binding flagellar brake protein YcgR
MNVSRGGMFVVAKKIESPGTTLEVIFDFGKEDTRKIQAKAVVVWNRGEPGAVKEDKVLPPGMGIKFIKIFPRESENFFGELIEKWDKND